MSVCLERTFLNSDGSGTYRVLPMETFATRDDAETFLKGRGFFFDPGWGMWRTDESGLFHIVDAAPRPQDGHTDTTAR